jgi:hypothetical protein
MATTEVKLRTGDRVFVTWEDEDGVGQIVSLFSYMLGSERVTALEYDPNVVDERPRP